MAAGSSPIRLLAGPRAARLIAEQGLRAADVSVVVGAAGGPKGLGLLGLDRFVFGHWLPAAARPRSLIGASIGAWRMCAAAQADPLRALDRLEHSYLEAQRYTASPGTTEVSRACRQITRHLIGGDPQAGCPEIDPRIHLQIITSRSSWAPTARPRGRFLRAALANLGSRERLGRHLQRVVFSSQSTLAHPAIPRDRFATRLIGLTSANLEDALLASGSIPLLADPVRSIVGAPAGEYWDGGLVDYHFYWPFERVPGLVLIPHFVPWITAGWLDKFLPWRRHGVGSFGANWLDNVLIVAPSAALLARLPGGRLPDRADFHRFGTDHDGRLRQWRGSIAECGRMAQAFAEFIEDPAPHPLEALP